MTKFANDNFTYFASQRVLATRWSECDPDLENRYDIQVQMVHELETNSPPYIVLDSEFDNIDEPNDSSRSSKVTLLDDYLHKNYRHIETFSDQAIWQRVPPAQLMYKSGRYLTSRRLANLAAQVEAEDQFTKHLTLIGVGRKRTLERGFALWSVQLDA